MRPPRDPVVFDAAALFAQLRELDRRFDPAAPRHWHFSFRHEIFERLAAVAEDLLDAMVSALGREPRALEPHLSQAGLQIDERGRRQIGLPQAEIDFTDTLAPAELRRLHAAFEDFSERHGLTYEGVDTYEALADDWRPAETVPAAPRAPARKTGSKKPAAKKAAAPKAPPAKKSAPKKAPRKSAR